MMAPSASWRPREAILSFQEVTKLSPSIVGQECCLVTNADLDLSVAGSHDLWRGYCCMQHSITLAAAAHQIASQD